jgi:flagellar biogenesis protein FliO
MRAWPILTMAWLLLLPAVAVSAEEGLTYTPPVCPEPPAVAPLLLRLGLATVAVLGLCVGMMWLARRGLLAAAPSAAGQRLRLLETMSLSGGSFLYLFEVGGKQYVAGVNRGCLQVLVPLAEPFDQALATFADELAA